MDELDTMSDSARFVKILATLSQDSGTVTLLDVSNAGLDLRGKIPHTTKRELVRKDLFWVKNIHVASSNISAYESAIDFLVIEGCISDSAALNVITAFKNCLEKGQPHTITPEGELIAKHGNASPGALIEAAIESLPPNHLLNVSNAPVDFTSGMTAWPESEISVDNIHYIKGIKLCSNNMTTYRLALSYLSNDQSLDQFLIQLAQMENGHSVKAPV